MVYLKHPLAERLPEGAVYEWEKGIIFNCPCNSRQVYVASPPHTISFDSDGRLSLGKYEGDTWHPHSCGYEQNPDLKRPANWCHFLVKDGEYEMCGDAQCPGRLL